jgi:hypothetical protein
MISFDIPGNKEGFEERYKEILNTVHCEHPFNISCSHYAHLQQNKKTRLKAVKHVAIFFQTFGTVAP